MLFKRLQTSILILLVAGACHSQNQSQKSIAATLIEYSYDNTDKAISYYQELKKNHEDAYNFQDENELNGLGYRLINDNRIDDAVKVFQLMISEFPNSFNAFDSMGEAYFLSGNTDLALKNYRKSLELNPNNGNAEQFITRISYENRDKNKFHKVYKKQEYLQDLDELAKTLTTVNPTPYKFMAKEEFWDVVRAKKELITDNTTYSEFIWHCSELVANINCGHSGIYQYFGQESEMIPPHLRFPMEVFNLNKKLFVSDALVNKKYIKPGSEIASINGKPTKDIIDDINKHIASQGNVGNPAKRHLYNWRSTALIAYSLGFPKKYEVTLKGETQPVFLDMLETYQDPLPKPRTCNETFCLDFIGQNEDIALLTVHHWDFYGGRFAIMKEFIEKSFAEIKARESKNLIIDVRKNGGGNSQAAAYLLQHLVKEPFTYFKEAPANDRKLNPLNPVKNAFRGDVYFISDGRAGSSTGQLLALAKHLKIGTIIGEESNGGVFYTGGQRLHELTNTGVFYKVGRFAHITNAGSIPENTGVKPDYYSVQTIEDYLNNFDSPKAFTLKLIEQQ